MADSYRTRFAPSPTGLMHLGHARTALVAWLRARSAGGRIVMRIEDLDGPRVVAGSADGFLKDHEWLGLDWDEGPIYQSNRFERYERALELLRARDLVYPCTCSRKEIAKIASAPHEELGVRYPGTCRDGIHRSGRPEAQRFRGNEASIVACDAVFGEVIESVDDFVLRRGDGVWSYQLAVVVDDIDMSIAEVVRGADLLSSTPRQIALHRALGQTEPSFAHIPLVLGQDGARLSKRHSSVTVRDYREAGWTPEELIGMLASSLALVDATTPCSAFELVPAFDIRAIPRADSGLSSPFARPSE